MSGTISTEPPPVGVAPATRRPAPVATVPWGLQVGAAYAWRLLIVAAGVFLVFTALARLRVVTAAVLVALLLTALLGPAVARLKRTGIPRLAATWMVLLPFLLSAAIVVYLIGKTAGNQFGAIGPELTRALDQIRDYLSDGPLHLSDKQIDEYRRSIGQQLSAHRSQLVTGVLTGATVAAEVVSGLLLALFTTFFFLLDGERIWHWVLGLLPRGARPATDGAGRSSWVTLGGYIRGTAFVAAVDATSIGLALLVLRVPLVVPLTALTFLASFIPLAGATVAGVVAVLVALVTRGPFIALLVIAAVIAVQQVEGHLLQPLVLGRAVRLHPLAIVLALTTGATLAGIPGAIVAVPLAAVTNTFVRRVREHTALPDR